MARSGNVWSAMKRLAMAPIATKVSFTTQAETKIGRYDVVKIIDIINHRNAYTTQTFVVVDQKPDFKFIRDGEHLIAEDSGFFYFYGYRKSTKAFCGREFDIPLLGGGVEKATGQWWHCTPDNYVELVESIGAGSPEELGRCNVFASSWVDPQIVNEWLANNEPSNNYDKYCKGHKNFGKHTIKSRFERVIK